MLEPIRDERERRGAPGRLAFGNCILDALPQADASQMYRSMRRVFLQRDETLVKPGEPIVCLHFPIDSFAWSWTETTGANRRTSVLTVGRRGVIEWNRVLESDRGQTCVTVISPGEAWRMPIGIFDQLPARAGLRRLLLRFANSSILNGACRLACDSEHNIDQRVARWLLWIADECDCTEFAITHQQIADIAAIRRPSVSHALSGFQRRGLLRSQHGRLRLLDRAAFESIVCQCYWNIRANAEAVCEE